MSSLIGRGSGIFMPYHMKDHLFAVMNDPDDEGFCLAVMVSSIKENRHHDPSCILDDGDHDFLDHPSYAVYRLAETVRLMHVEKMVEKKLYRLADPFREEVFRRIRDGLFESDETVKRILNYAAQVGI